MRQDDRTWQAWGHVRWQLVLSRGVKEAWDMGNAGAVGHTKHSDGRRTAVASAHLLPVDDRCMSKALGALGLPPDAGQCPARPMDESGSGTAHQERRPHREH